jgi:Asp-tRNA(Asn)/Glu-tRNA(Gln) amidotransferase A subunit family amidase
VVVGKTSLPELAFEAYTAGRLYGVTRNPWAPAWSAGGSSGGSGAALMMGLAPLVTGTDGGGSIRIPASLCGFAGLKPTNGLIGRSPIPSWIDLSTKGPMATSVADVRLLLGVLAGPVAGDPTALPDRSPAPSTRATRILAAPRLLPHGPLPAGVAGSWDRAVRALGAASGTPVEPVGEAILPDTTADDDWFLLCSVEELTWIGRERAEREADRFGHVAGVLRHAAKVTLDEYLAARRRRFAYTRVLDELLGDDAVLATPTMAVEGISADGRMPGAEEPGTPEAACNTQLQNLTGHPAISLPAGLSANGVPFGLQLTGPRFADELLLTLAERWEAAEPWPAVARGYEPFAA